MKSLLKFSLLFALIIAGKITKKADAVAASNKPVTATHPDSVILVHQVVQLPAATKARPHVAEPESTFLAAF